MRIILITGLAISMMAGPFSVKAAEPKRVVITHTDQAALLREYPGITITTDRLSASLYKILPKPYYLSHQAQASGMKLSTPDSIYLRNINRWKTIRYKAALYDSTLLHDLSHPANDADIKKYYGTHPSDYRHYAIATYIQAAINAGHENDTAELRQQLKALANNGADKSSFKKSSNEKWSINMEQDVVISPHVPSYSTLSHTQKGAITSARTGSTLTYYLILGYQPETAVPIDSVRDMIKAAIVKQQLETRYATIAHDADSLIPIRLDIATLQLISGKDANTIYGIIGEDSISNSFIAAVQMVNPQFHFSGRADDFGVLLRSYVSIPMIKASLLKKMSTQDSFILERIMSYTYEFALADKYDKAQKEQINNVPESEILSYYQSHQNLYMRYGRCSYLKAELIDSSPISIALAQKDILAAHTGGSFDKIKKPGKYTITDEPDRNFDPGLDLYYTIKNTPLHSVSDPVRIKPDALPLLILPYRKEDAVPKPLSEVHDLCRQALANEKLETYNEKMKARIFDEYTFVIE